MDDLVMREILDVRRCTRCDAVLQVMVQDDTLDESGYPVRAVYWLPPHKHGDDECNRMLTLAQEAWPRLFEMEA
jgi:hypothetical protein